MMKDREIRAFTLVEMLLVIVVIGVMSSLIISAVSNAASDSRLVVARQQQAVVQEAVNAWISAKSSGTGSLNDARIAYAAGSDKIGLISNYLDPRTYAHFVDYSSGGSVKTEAMSKLGQSLVFSAWTSSNAYPEVKLQ